MKMFGNGQNPFRQAATIQLDADRELWAAPCWQTPIALEAEKKLNLQ